jgi:hypothetical protein
MVNVPQQESQGRQPGNRASYFGDQPQHGAFPTEPGVRGMTEAEDRGEDQGREVSPLQRWLGYSVHGAGFRVEVG